MVQFPSLEDMSTRIRMALLIEVTSISELRIFLHVFDLECLPESSRYGNIRSNIRRLYKDGHVYAEKEFKERGMSAVDMLLQKNADQCKSKVCGKCSGECPQDLPPELANR